MKRRSNSFVESIYYLNGQFVKTSQAKISVLDLGFVRGWGVFDFLRTYQGQPFKLDSHLTRLQRSARQIGLKLPYSKLRLSKLVYETLEKNRLPEANIKILVSGGVSPDQITPGDKPTLAILVYPAFDYPKSFYEKGVKVITVPLGRAFPQAKTTNYIPAMLALAQARAQRAIEALYKNEKGEVLEGTTTNFFIFAKETLITPEKGILPGITREVVLALARKEFKVQTRPIKYAELKAIQEAFITASNKEVMPVTRIDNLKIGSGRVGKNTKRIMALFRQFTRE